MRHILILFVLFVSVQLVVAQDTTPTGQAPATQSTWVTKTLKVSGNCASCKKKIEAPFKEMKGVESASWDKKLKTFVIKFDSSVLNEQKIKETIAAQGYDAEDVKASDEVYSKLPKCCRYRDGSHD